MLMHHVRGKHNTCIICSRKIRTGYMISLGGMSITCCKSHIGNAKRGRQEPLAAARQTAGAG